MCVLMCLYIHVAVKGEPQMVFPLRSIHFLVLLVSFLRQDLTEEDRLSGQSGPGIHLSPAPQSYDCRLVLLYPVLNKHGIWGSDCPSIIHIFPLSCFFAMFFIVSFIYPWTMLFRTPRQESLIIVMKTIYISVIAL